LLTLSLCRYWNDRYQASDDEGFDWLFSYDNVKHFLTAIFDQRDKDAKHKQHILLTGAGNAPFSFDM
jgi:hypothetical protein